MKIDDSKLLVDMYSDTYFPNHLVDKSKQVLLNLCDAIENTQPRNAKELYVLTHRATEKFNQLEDEFDAAGSEIETMARDSIAVSFAVILDETGIEYDLEEALAPREW